MGNSKRDIIRSKLNEFKTHKKNILTEEKIIKNRLSLVFESSLNENKLDVNTLTTSLISEVVYLQDQGYDDKLINEQVGSFFGLLKSISGDSFGSFIDTLKERIAGGIMKMLKIKKSTFLGSLIMTTVGNIDSKDLPRLFDCRFIAAKIAESLPEAFVAQKLRAKAGDGLMGWVTDVLRNAVVDNVVNDTTFMNKIEDKIANTICGFLNNMTRNITRKYDDMTGSLRNQISSQGITT